MFQTAITKNWGTRDHGKRNMHNGKPYRTKAQKAEAKRTAYRTTDGSWHAPAHVSFHPPTRQLDEPQSYGRRPAS